MTTLSIQPPFPILTDADGQPLEDGYIWIGTANLPPIGNPVAVYWDAALTQTAVQPIRTRGGYPVNAGTPARLYVGSDYSILVQNKNGSTLYSAPDGASDRFSAAQISFLQAGAGAVARTAQDKMRETVSDTDRGVVSDSSAVNSGTNASSGLQTAIDESFAPTSAGISGTGGSAIVGGGALLFAASALAKRIGASINVTRSKIVIRGPARLNIDTGVTALLWNYIGSSDKSGVVFEYIDFVGGAIAADIGTNSDAMPAAFWKCNFINQTIASIKIGNNGYWVDISRCRFSGNVKGVWHNGSAADGVNIERSVFIYNAGYDIYLSNGANVCSIINNDFVGNLGGSPANIRIDTATAQTGAYTVIERNKFGPEGRVAGCMIEINGTNPLIGAKIVKNPVASFDSSVVGSFIKLVGGVPLRGCTIEDNNLEYCKLFDPTGSEATNGQNGQNKIGRNYFYPIQYGNVNRGDFDVLDYGEPPTTQKCNLFTWSRYVNAGAYFTYTNATPSYMTATDENGVANNATTVLATAANNIIRVNSLDTNSTQKKYTLAIWCKLDVAGTVTMYANRGSDYAFNVQKDIGTSFQRVVIEFEQTYLAAGSPYVFDIVIPNGRTITLGGVCCVPGRDIGDLRAILNVKEYADGISGANAPTSAIYWPAGTRLTNSAPALGQPKGWLCTVAGNPGTWVSEGNL